MSAKPKEPREEKLPPQDLVAEQATLGSILIDPGVAALALGQLETADFYLEAHQVLFRAMRAVRERGDPVDLIMTSAELRRKGDMERAGGAEYLTALINSVPTAAHVTRYAEIVRKKSLLRRVIAFAAKTQEQAYSDPAPETLPAFLAEVVAGAQGLHDLARPPIAETTSLADLGEALRNTSWLWPGWLPQGHLTVLGGETGIGKSLTAQYLGAAATGQMSWPDQTAPPAEGGRVLWIDTEGRQGVLFGRLDEWGIDPAPFMLPGGDGLGEVDLGTPGTAAQIARQSVTCGARLVVVDSLSGGHKLDENSAVLRVFLKEMQQAARDNGLAILLVHHATKRGPLQGPEMTLDRLRGSSTISQFAVSVLALDRPDANSQQVRLHALKMNLRQAPEPLGFAIDGEGGFPCWGDPPEKPVVLGLGEQAARFLRDQLKAGPRLAAEVRKAADDAGFGRRAVDRAKRMLEVVVYQRGGPGQWWWQLP